MDILFIGGVFAESNEPEVINNSKGGVEFSANAFQKKLIGGFEENGDNLHIISAPLIGAYPFRYKKARFCGFRVSQYKYQYVRFNNIWGYRNISRAYSLKKAIKKYLHNNRRKVDLIVVYSAHTPFLQAAIEVKKICASAPICLIVPDLPQYMNLDENRSKFYDLLKKIDIQIIDKLMQKIDSFVILTEPMKDILHIGSRPYLVVEGIADELPKVIDYAADNLSIGIKRIVYTGKMNIRFGVKELVDSFMKMSGSEYRLILCGDGDAKNYIIKKAKQDKRIEYVGQLSPEKAKEWVSKADVLVNPRANNEEYTNYSFPSKNIEYLLSGKPVVAYMLSGMPQCYSQFIYEVDQKSDDEACAKAILKGLSHEDFDQKRAAFMEYLREHLTPKDVAQRICRMVSGTLDG